MTRLVSRIGVALAVIGIGLTLSGCGYNTIPTLEEQAKARWADVQNQYQRRADLIPNLVATVQGYAAQEKNVLTAVVEARAKATQIKIDASAAHRSGQAQSLPGRAEPVDRRARPAAGGERRTIPTSNPTPISWRCSRSSKAPRTASRWRGATTSTRCAPTIRRCAPSRPCSGRRLLFSGNKPMAEFTANEGAEKPPQVKF